MIDYDWKGLKTAERKFIKSADGEIILERELRRIYDNYNMILEIIDTSGKPREVRKYYYGEDAAGSLYATGGTRGLVMIEVNGTQAYVMSDILGSVDSLYRSDTGELIGSYEYDFWGEITDIRQSERFASGGHNPSSASGTSNQQSLNNDLDYQKLLKTNPIRYSTRYYESEPNLHYYAFRHYAPTLKRWLSRDPIEEVGGHNLYTFCNNDPIGKFDSLGLSSTVCYPDGKSDCEIVIFFGHGSENGYGDISREMLNYTSKNRKNISSGRITKYGVISCYQKQQVKAMSIMGEVIDNEFRSGAELDLGGLFSVESIFKYARLEIEAAKRAAKSMCENECCKYVDIKLRKVPMIKFEISGWIGLTIMDMFLNSGERIECN